MWCTCDILLTISDSLQFDWSDADLSVQGDSLLTAVGNETMTHPEQIANTRGSPQPSRKRTHSQTLTDHKPWCVVFLETICCAIETQGIYYSMRVCEISFIGAFL